jgi:hypothetical protein
MISCTELGGITSPDCAKLIASRKNRDRSIPQITRADHFGEGQELDNDIDPAAGKKYVTYKHY